MTDHALTLTRRFGAPPARVFALWADARHRLAWWSPRGLTCAEFTHDFRVGGAWQARLEGTETGRSFWMGGKYRVIDPPNRLSFTFAWLEGGNDPGPESVIDVTLTADRDGTLQDFHQAPFETAEARDAHGEGWGECLERLADLIESGQRPTG